MSPDTLRSQIDYSAWASRRLVAAVSQLPSDKLTRDFGTADRSIVGTLAHVYGAERLWLARLTGGAHPGLLTDADRQLAVLENDWPALQQRWQEWGRGIDAESAAAPVAYHDLRGNPWSQPLWQLVLHVVNHGTHHRGQVSGFLRAMGHTPPPIDLVVYHREFPATPPDPR